MYKQENTKISICCSVYALCTCTVYKYLWRDSCSSLTQVPKYPGGSGDTKAVSWWHQNPGHCSLMTLLPVWWVFLVYGEMCLEFPPVPLALPECHRCPGCDTGGACAIPVPFCVPRDCCTPSRHNVWRFLYRQCTVCGAVSSCSPGWTLLCCFCGWPWLTND